MSWRGTQAEARRRTLEAFDAAGVEDYESLAGTMPEAEQTATLDHLGRALAPWPGSRVLDAGAGTGAMCALLARDDELTLTALEPAPAMLSRLRAKPELAHIEIVQGFCDAPDDRAHFSAARFDVIISRQLCNGLFDPLAAFENWHHWLVPGGATVVVDGLYDRSAWRGRWAPEVDALPLAATQSMASVPYLLERAGFEIESVEEMMEVNALPTTRTPRYLSVARKPA